LIAGEKGNVQGIPLAKYRSGRDPPARLLG